VVVMVEVAVVEWPTTVLETRQTPVLGVPVATPPPQSHHHAAVVVVVVVVVVDAPFFL
jgi:hypothetical protein